MNTTKNSTKKGVIQFGKFRWIAAGGIFMLILAMCLLSPLGNSGNFYTSLQDKLSQTLEMFSVRGGEGEQNIAIRDLKKCMELYNQENYADAIPKFEEFLANHPEASNTSEAKLYLGVSYLNISNAEKANEILAPLSQDNEFALQEDATWYLGFTHVFMRDLDIAKNIFASLSNSKTYGPRVQAMMEAKPSKENDKVVFK